MNSKKIAIFGCKSTTQLLIENLVDLVKIDWLITINENLASKFEVADYTDLKPICNQHNIKIYQANNYSLKSEIDLNFFTEEKIDLVLVAGWQRLVPENILNTFSIGSFGMHGSALDLPKGRGRSPMNWALIEGKQQFYTNLFKYDPGVDSGDVLDTFKFQITNKDNAESMHFKNTLSMIYLVKKNIASLLNADFKLVKQKSYITPTYYPKRSPDDSLIDWENDISSIERFIRAVSPPFNCAFAFLNNINKIKIIEAQQFDTSDFGYSNDNVGTIVQIFPNNKFLLKCYGGLLYVSKYECEQIPKRNDFINNGIMIHNNFPRNEQGNFDIIE